MVLCVSLNPALQRTLVIESFKTSSVNKAASVYIDPSGKAGNCARALKFLGEDALHFTFWGGGTGADFEALTREQGLALDGVKIPAPTRICSTIIDRSKNTVTELVEPGLVSPDFPYEEYLKKFRKAVRKSRLVLFCGSRAPGLREDFYPFLAGICQEEKTPFWLDLQGRDLVSCLPLKPDLVKINFEEFDAAFSEKSLKVAERKALAAKTSEATGVRFILTNGKGPVLSVWGREVLDFQTECSTEVLCTTGCGDSFLAGAATAFLNGAPWDQLIEWGQKTAMKSAGTWRPGWLGETFPVHR